MPHSECPRPYRKGSVYGDGRRSRLDGNQRARFRFRLKDHARSGRLPAKQEWVGLALLKRLGEDGRCDPSLETLAKDSGCSPRTVQRAMVTMRDLGLVRWETRLVRSKKTDWQAHQTSNAYELTPDAPTPAVSHGRQSGQQTQKKVFKTILAPSCGSDEWGRWNAERQLAEISGPTKKEEAAREGNETPPWTAKGISPEHQAAIRAERAARRAAV